MSKSIAKSLDEQGRLAASFFFDKSARGDSANSSKLFISTLARQLADFQPSYRSALSHLLDNNPRAVSLIGKDQLKTLILDPLSAVSTDSIDSPLVIILDGLDECGNQRDLEYLMEIILDFSRLPSHFRILVSSRPEREVFDVMLRLPFGVPMHDTDRIPTQETERDISKYVHKRLPDIPSRGCLNWPPSSDDMQVFAKQCGGIFEIARIRIRILEESRATPLDRAFRRLLEDTRRGLPKFETEYLRILRRAYLPTREDSEELEFVDEGDQMDKDEVLARYRRVVGTIVSLRQSPDITLLAALLSMPCDDIYSVLRPIASIIEVPSPNRPMDYVHFFHATAREFLLSKPTSTVEEDSVFFFSDSQGTYLAPICLQILTRYLQPNQPITLNYRQGNRDFPRGYVGLWVHLRYAMRHWTAHIQWRALDEEYKNMLRDFMRWRLVMWTEAVVWSEVLDKVGFVPRKPLHRVQLLKCLEDLVGLSEVRGMKLEKSIFTDYHHTGTGT